MTDKGLRILKVHGSAYALGDAATLSGLVCEFVRRAVAHAVSVHHRLAPDHPSPPSPAAVDDVLTFQTAMPRQRGATRSDRVRRRVGGRRARDRVARRGPQTESPAAGGRGPSSHVRKFVFSGVMHPTLATRVSHAARTRHWPHDERLVHARGGRTGARADAGDG